MVSGSILQYEIALGASDNIASHLASSANLFLSASSMYFPSISFETAETEVKLFFSYESFPCFSFLEIFHHHF